MPAPRLLLPASRTRNRRAEAMKWIVPSLSLLLALLSEETVATSVAPVVVAGATIAEGRPADLQLHAVPLGGDTDVLRGEALPLGPAVGVGDRPELAHFLETSVAHPTLAPLVAGDDARACRRREKD